MSFLHSRETGGSCAAIMARVAAAMRDSEAHVTNIESVLKGVGVSLREISRRFGGTRELMLAMTSELTDMMSAPLAAIAMSADLRQGLLEFGEHVFELCTSSHWHGLCRVAVTESIRRTGVARDFHEVGPRRLTDRLAGLLRTAQGKGVLRSGDPHLLASRFLSPLINPGECSIRGPRMSAVARNAYVRSVVDLFCDGINGGGRLC